MEINSTVLYLMCLMVILIIGKIFIVPLKLIIKLLINSVLGMVLLYLINIIGTMCGFHIGINAITALIVGLLGIPGALLLVFFSIFML